MATVDTEEIALMGGALRLLAVPAEGKGGQNLNVVKPKLFLISDEPVSRPFLYLLLSGRAHGLFPHEAPARVRVRLIERNFDGGFARRNARELAKAQTGAKG